MGDLDVGLQSDFGDVAEMPAKLRLMAMFSPDGVSIEMHRDTARAVARAIERGQGVELALQEARAQTGTAHAVFTQAARVHAENLAFAALLWRLSCWLVLALTATAALMAGVGM